MSEAKKATNVANENAYLLLSGIRKAVASRTLLLTQVHILTAIRGGDSNRDVVTRTGLSAPAVCRAINRLVEDGLVTRRHPRGAKHDERLTLLALTAKGERAVSGIAKLAGSTETIVEPAVHVIAAPGDKPIVVEASGHRPRGHRAAGAAKEMQA